MTLFTVEGELGLLIVLSTSALWIWGLVDSSQRKRPGWTVAIAVFNFPAALLWLLARRLPEPAHDEFYRPHPGPKPSFEAALESVEEQDLGSKEKPDS